MDEQKPFSNLLVAVWAKDPAQGAVLENVRIQSLGDRPFIVGQLADDGTNDIRTGLTYWFAVDDVLMITEFRDMDQVRAYYAERDRKAKTERPSLWLRKRGRVSLGC